jgi:hypothetical protein
MTVRRTAWRAAFFADFVLAIRAGHKRWRQGAGLIGSWRDTVNGTGQKEGRETPAAKRRARTIQRAGQATRLARTMS